MSGHSKWATIKRAKGANDAKRGAVFTKLGNQIAIAARSGSDPATNASLAMIIEKARAANMPSANIQRSIDRVKDKSAATLEEVTYEAYAPGGVGVIIEATTDNRNRTFPEIKNTLSKFGGTIAEPGSVSFQFDLRGMIRVKGDSEEVLLKVLESDAEDATQSDTETLVYTSPKQLAQVREQLVQAGLQLEEAGLEYVPKNLIPLDSSERQEKLLKLLEALDEIDDIVNVSSNAEFKEV